MAVGQGQDLDQGCTRREAAAEQGVPDDPEDERCDQARHDQPVELAAEEPHGIADLERAQGEGISGDAGEQGHPKIDHRIREDAPARARLDLHAPVGAGTYDVIGHEKERREDAQGIDVGHSTDPPGNTPLG